MHRTPAATKALRRGFILRSPSRAPTSPHRSLQLLYKDTNSYGRSSNLKGDGGTGGGGFRYMSSDGSSSSKSSGAVKIALVGGVTVLSLAGGTLGYAGIDPEFRSYVESVVPGSKEVFETILGSTEEVGGSAKTPSKLERVKQFVTSSITSDDSAVSSPPSKLKHTTVDAEKLKGTSDPTSGEDKSEKEKVEIISQTIPGDEKSEEEKIESISQPISPLAVEEETSKDEQSISDVELPHKEPPVPPSQPPSLSPSSKDEESIAIVEPPLEDPEPLPSQPPSTSILKPSSPPPLPSTSYFPLPLEQVPSTPADGNEKVEVKEESKMPAALPLPSTLDSPPPLEEVPSKPAGDDEKVEVKEELKIPIKAHYIMTDIESAILNMNDLTKLAENASKSCQEAIEKHSVLVEKVLEKAVGDDNDADDGTWRDVFEAANIKSDAMGNAQTQVKEAKASIKRALEAVERGKASEDSKIANSLVVIESDGLVNEALLKIQAVDRNLESATKDSKLVEEYRDLVEEGRQQFRREIAALLPDTSPDRKSIRKGPLSQDELDVFVTHAYRKVCRLQQELAKQKALAQQRLETSITDEQLRKQVVTEEVVQAELEAQRRLLDVEHQRKMDGIREEMESEVRSQLRRQAGAHADHIKDVLDVQESELKRKHNLVLDEELSKERSAHQKELAAVSGRVEGIKTVARQRAQLELKIREAQELWLACKALSLALSRESPPHGVLPPIKTEVEAIKRVADKTKSIADGVTQYSGVEFVDSVLDSVPREALDRGVYTDQSLRDRFFRVEKMAKRTALVENEDSSLLLYLLSYILSFLRVESSIEKLPDSNENLDVDSLSTFDVVALARGCVERGEIAQAVRYMTLLNGEPANVSKDWIKEARLLLETQQACNALLAHAAAFGLEIFPQQKELKSTEKSCCHGKS